MAEHIIESILLFLPEIALVVTLVAAVIADLILGDRNYRVAWVVLAGLGVAILLTLQQLGVNESIFSDMLAVDPYAVFFKLLILVSGVFIVLFSLRSRDLQHNAGRLGEYYMLLTGVIFGMVLMAGATHLLLMYLVFELSSISSYVLAGFTRHLRKSAEAALKYIVFGAVSSGFMLYGISLLAGVTGALDIYGIRDALANGVDQPLVLYLSLVMIIAGFSYKITVIPFHFWAPDVYEGAPVTITTFLATASKIAGFALMIRFFRISFMETGVLETGMLDGFAAVVPWNIVLAVIAAFTMIAANLMALWQENIKRLLAYSGIGHAGFILMGLALLTDEGISAMMIYLALYLFMNLGAFLVAIIVSNKLQTELITGYKGLGQRSPMLAVSMAIFLVALAGFPPTAGFIAKVYIFGATISAGWIWLVATAGLASIIALFYYIRVVRTMFLETPKEGAGSVLLDKEEVAMLVVLLIPVLLLGVYFAPLVSWVRSALVMVGM